MSYESIAIIDLDGVVANNTERFARASTNGRIDWKVAFDPALVPLDTLIEGADLAVKRLEQQHYTIVFLTSRPEKMREATETWLAQHDLDGYELIMKSLDMQFVKTVRWKADEVQAISQLRMADTILFVDDEEANREAVAALGNGIVIKESLDDYKPDDTPIII